MLLSFRTKPCLLALSCLGLLLASPFAAATTPPAKVPPKAAPTARPQPPLASPQLLAQMLLSEIALARGQFDDAAVGYTDLARRSNDPRIQQRAREVEQARIMLYALHRPAEAEQLLRQQLLQDQEGRERLLLQLPGIYARNPDKDLVLQTIQRLTLPYAQLAEAHHAEGSALRDAGNAAAGHAAALRAHRLKPDWEPAVLLLGQLANDARRTETREILEAFAQRNPQALDTRVGLIRFMLQDKQYDQARHAYRQLLNEQPANPELAFALTAVAIETADLPGAEAILEKLLAQNWGDADRLHLILGQVQVELGKSDAALLSFEAVAPGQHFVSAQSHKARLLVARKQNAAARASLRNAARLMPEERADLLVQEAALLRQNGDKRSAFTVLEEALAHEPEHLEALYDSALLAEQLENTALMEQRLRRVIALKPDHAHALNALGYSFADRNIRLDEAETLLAQALKLAPQDPAILDSMGWLRFRQNRLPEAESLLRGALTLFPDPEVASHLIETLFTAGQQDAARRQWRESLSANPGNPLLLKTGKRLGLQE